MTRVDLHKRFWFWWAVLTVITSELSWLLLHALPLVTTPVGYLYRLLTLFVPVDLTPILLTIHHPPAILVERKTALWVVFIAVIASVYVIDLVLNKIRMSVIVRLGLYLAVLFTLTAAANILAYGSWRSMSWFLHGIAY